MYVHIKPPPNTLSSLQGVIGCQFLANSLICCIYGDIDKPALLFACSSQSRNLSKHCIESLCSLLSLCALPCTNYRKNQNHTDPVSVGFIVLFVINSSAFFVQWIMLLSSWVMHYSLYGALFYFQHTSCLFTILLIILE